MIYMPENNKLCIFQQPWWLDTVAPNNWKAAEVIIGDEIRARLPYVFTRGLLGLRIITMPQLTPRLGPWLAPSKAKYAKQLAQQKDLVNALIDQLPPHDYFWQNFHYSITNWLPFYWRGFDAKLLYSYVIDNLEDIDRVWAGFLDNIRTDIRKAQKKIVVRGDLGIEHFLKINSLTFKRQGKKIPYSFDLVMKIDTACQARNVRRMLFAEDAQGQIHAALYLVWDENSAFYLMGGSDPALRNSGATSLVMWEAIKFAATVTKQFDFEGSMMEPVERFFRAFGAVQKPYFSVTKLSPRAKFFMVGRDLIRTFRRK
jgi:hypothetical protein